MTNLPDDDMIPEKTIDEILADIEAGLLTALVGFQADSLSLVNREKPATTDGLIEALRQMAHAEGVNDGIQIALDMIAAARNPAAPPDVGTLH